MLVEFTLTVEKPAGHKREAIWIFIHSGCQLTEVPNSLNISEHKCLVYLPKNFLWWISQLFRDSWLFLFPSARGRGGLNHSYGVSLLFLTLANTSGWIYEHRYLPHRSSWKDWEWCQSKPSPLLLSAQSKMELGGTWRETTADNFSETEASHQTSTASVYMTRRRIKTIWKKLNWGFCKHKYNHILKLP